MLSALPPRERQIVDILYERGPCLVGDICTALDDEVSGSAVRAMLKRLEDKGFVSREPSEAGFRYAPAVPENAARKSALGQVVKTFFNNSPVGSSVPFLSRSSLTEPKTRISFDSPARNLK